jgi:hypothetical protein
MVATDRGYVLVPLSKTHGIFLTGTGLVVVTLSADSESVRASIICPRS